MAYTNSVKIFGVCIYQQLAARPSRPTEVKAPKDGLAKGLKSGFGILSWLADELLRQANQVNSKHQTDF
jgi:hypothetical protein